MEDEKALIENLALQTIRLLRTEYPNELRRPRAAHPAFYGCYDWHSAVHSHWQLVRAIRVLPDASFVEEAI